MKSFFLKHLYLIYTLLNIIFLAFVFLEGLRPWENFSFFPGLMFVSLLFIIAGVWVIAVSPPVKDNPELAVISKDSGRSSSISVKAITKIIKKIAAGISGLNVKNVIVLPSKEGLILDVEAAVKNSSIEEIYQKFTKTLNNVLNIYVGAKVSEINLKVIKAFFSKINTKSAESSSDFKKEEKDGQANSTVNDNQPINFAKGNSADNISLNEDKISEIKRDILQEDKTEKADRQVIDDSYLTIKNKNDSPLLSLSIEQDKNKSFVGKKGKTNSAKGRKTKKQTS